MSPGRRGELADEREATRQYRQALAIDPDLTEARVQFGRALQRAGDPEQAVEELGRAADQGGGGPTGALAQLFLGEILDERGDAEEAARRYRSALEQDPTLQQAGLALATILWRTGDRAGTLEVPSELPSRADARSAHH